MDEKVFRNIYSGYDPQPCHFNKAIQLGCAHCSHSQQVLIAEREALSCLSRAGYARCGMLLDLLREKAAFALGMPQAGSGLPHGKEMKVECGGLQALAGLCDQTQGGDIDTLLDAAIQRYRSLAEIPYGEVVRSISRYSLRKRSRQPRSE